MSGFLLQQLLLNPQAIGELSNAQIQDLISQARSARLLASLTVELDACGALEQLPLEVSRHFRSALLVHNKQRRDLEFECREISATLAAHSDQFILLKGAAYMLADLPVGRGRLITDIDIIVPLARIEDVEKNLNNDDWESSYVDSYNEYYYRKWGHEIPPLTHAKRDTTLDVHHNILPPTAGPNVDASLLFDTVIEVRPGVFTLSLPDMVIHSATHLFHEGEFHHGLRDLWDLDRMLRDFPIRQPDFWEHLVTRAEALDLVGPLFHGINYVQQVFETPVPGNVIKAASSRGRVLRKPLMDFLFLRAFRPDHPLCKLPLTGLALYLLYVRSHYLRMPLYLLLPHLARKAWMSRFEEDKTSIEQEGKKET